MGPLKVAAICTAIVRSDVVVAIGGNLGNSVRRRFYPLYRYDRLLVDEVQEYSQETYAGDPPPEPDPGNLPSLSTSRIFALLSPVEACEAVLSAEVAGGVLA